MEAQRTDWDMTHFVTAAVGGEDEAQASPAAPGTLDEAIQEGMRRSGFYRKSGEARYRREYARTVRMTPEEGFCLQFCALKEQKSANDLIMEWIRPHLEKAWPEAAQLYKPAQP